MSKFFTPVRILALLALLASPAAFAGRDSGGNGDSKLLSAGDEFLQGQELNKRDRCKENAHTSDQAKLCSDENYLETEQ
jgi:hypothetical protein